MLTSEALKFFGSKTVIAETLGISPQAVTQWGDLVPPLSAAKLAKRSRGKLKFDPDIYDSWNNSKTGS
jgi:transcriptional repressor of cell division inhibition gene dicB